VKVVKVEHTKCDQFSKAIYFIAPDNLTAEQFQADVDAAQAAYFAARKEFEKMTPQPDGWIRWADELIDERNGVTDQMTIAEAKALKQRMFAESKAWREARDATTGSFQKHLRERGYRTLVEADDELLMAEADWGHHHGENLLY
jgi:hypothetical protein